MSQTNALRKRYNINTQSDLKREPFNLDKNLDNVTRVPPIWDISRLTNPFIALAYPAIATISIFALNTLYILRKLIYCQHTC